MDNRQLPPQSVEAEMSVLGSVFLDNECLDAVCDMVDPLDFYRENHRKIFLCLVDLWKNGSPMDLVTTTQSLRSRGQLEETGGGAYIATLVDYVPTSANVAYYCRIMKEMATRRQIIANCQQLMTEAYDDERTVAEIIPEAKEAIGEICDRIDGIGGVSVKDLSTFKDRCAIYESKIKTMDRDRFITSFPELDTKIRGVAPGEVLTIVAEPGGFKTAFLQNILQQGANRTKLPTLLFSMEMPKEKIFEREVQMECEVSGWDVECHFRGQHQYGINVEEMRNRVNGLIVCAKPRLTLEKIARYIELTRKNFGGLAAIGIDYIQLMPGPGKIFDRIEHNAYGIKTMAKDLSIPAIILSQINVSGRKEKGQICFADAKGGGAIEEAADIGLGFYFDCEDTLVCNCLKNRNGPKGWNLAVDLNRKAFKFKGFSEYIEPKRKNGKGKKNEEKEDCPY